MSQLVCGRWPLSRFLALVVFLGSAGLFGFAGQPPKEEEDTKGKTVKKNVVVDDDPPPMTKKVTENPTGTFPDVRLEELARAADEARTAALKDLFTRYIIPFDRITEGSGATRVKPIPYRKSEWAGHDAVQVTPLDNAGKPKDVRAAKVSDVRNVEYFESLIQGEAEKLQKQPMEGLTSADQLAAAEKLLSAALRFHDYSRVARSGDRGPLNLRRGKGWDEVRDSVAVKLKVVQLELLRTLVTANDPIRLRELSSRLISTYPKDAEVVQAVAGVQVAEAERLFKSGSDQDCIAARKLIDELERTFPTAGGEPARKIRTQIRELALKALNRSKEKFAVGDKRTARDELVRAEALDPDLDGIREMQRKLQIDYPILYVGVRQYPQNMSPVTARLDSEKQAVELLFEGLLEEVPDESGAVRYRPGAALTMPVSVPGGREFSLRIERDAQGQPVFTNDDVKSQDVKSQDVVETVNLLRSRPHTWAAYPLTWLAADPPIPTDVGTVRVAFGLTPPDPRAALTFKLLPARWMLANGRAIDDGRFAEIPFGTGPFTLLSNPRPDGSNAAREMVFANNPAYGRYSDRAGLPRLREIRLIEVNKIDPIKAFQEGKLHFLPDIPTSEIEKYIGANSDIKNKVDVVTAAVNRRVHILAVNLRRPYLQSKQLRQGISLAIDREDILRREFRAGKPDVHRPMTGPFPPGSWPSARGPVIPVPLMDLNLAMVRLNSRNGYLADQGAKTTIELAYPDNDSQAENACVEIKKQVEGIFKNEPAGSRKLTINLVKVPLAELLVQVQDQHTFDLAYVPFDYPDDWYPYTLGAALDPTAGERGGRNWFGFMLRNTSPDGADEELGRALTKLRNYRDFAGELVPQSVAVSKLFNDSLPFIPLWQLDRHMVVSKRVKVFVEDTTEPVNPRLLNQTILFQGVGRWRIE
ncbi:MAG TPA: ABC transporter substrate-binding protein [Gemmata sp.]|nr:ABC transporter substrate-binding protein [Gemmata sp.]